MGNYYLSEFTIDHVTVAGPDLSEMIAAFSAAGLTPLYGGVHSNGKTHMAVIGFADGSYIELISALDRADDSEFWWKKQITENGGPCGWAISVSNIGEKTAVLKNLGIPVKGPAYYNRRRPDGRLAEWYLTFPGDRGWGAVLPFMIEDITERELRVPPEAFAFSRHPLLSAKDIGIRGISKVFIAVKNLAESIDKFRRVFNLPDPAIIDDPRRQASLAHFPGFPAVLVAPGGRDTKLAQRLERFDESPCAYLIEAVNLPALAEVFKLKEEEELFGAKIRWLDPEGILGNKIGFTEIK